MKKKQNSRGWMPVVVVVGVFILAIVGLFGWENWSKSQESADKEMAEKARQEAYDDASARAKEAGARADLYKEMGNLLQLADKGGTAQIRADARRRYRELNIREARRELDNAKTESERVIAKHKLEKLLDKSDTD